MAVATLVPIEEYLSTSYDPEPEYVDGRLIERNVGALDHSYLQFLIAELLKRSGLIPFTALTVQVSATRFRIPDVLATRQMPRQRFLREPPYIVVEILSREDKAAEIADKIDDYLDFGVPNIWVIDPRKQRLFVHTRDGARICGDSVDTSDGKISIPLTEIFGQMPVIEE